MQDFVLLLMGSEDWQPDSYSEQEWKDEMALHVAFADAVKAAGGAILASEALAPSTDAVRVAGGPSAPVFTDGPFTETKEIVNGFYAIRVADKAEAVRLAAMLPVGGGSTLVFPTFDVSTPSGAS